MSRVGSYDTGPEIVVRKILHSLGYRFRLHRRDLPGVPDITLPKYRTIIFVHGCFWHGHRCRKGKRPSSNIAFWNKKLDKNNRRDREAKKTLQLGGWIVMTIWECQLKKPELLKKRLLSIRCRYKSNEHLNTPAIKSRILEKCIY